MDGPTQALIAPTANAAPLNRTKQQFESSLSSFFKRLYAQLDLLVMFVNVIIAVFSISAAVSLIPTDNSMLFTGCDYGAPLATNVQCPYADSPSFAAFLSVWTIYFAVFLSYKIAKTGKYDTMDLRFYLASDMVNNRIFHRCMVGLGVVLTLVSAIVAISFVCHNGTVESLGSIFTFVGVNLYTLFTMRRGKLLALQKHHTIAAVLPTPVWITVPTANPGNLYGIAIPHSALTEYIVFAVLLSVSEGDSHPLNAMCSDPEILKFVALIINPLNTKNYAIAV